VSDDAPRLPPRPRADWDDDVRAAFRAAFAPEVAEMFLTDDPGAAEPPNVLSTLMHHPAIAGPVLRYNFVLLSRPALGERLRELVVLRVAYRTRAVYEWVQHVRLATAAGITPEEIDAIGRDEPGGDWTPLEADVLAATDQLLVHQRIDDATWNRLAAGLDRAQLVELVFVAGTYACLAMAFNSFGLRVDPELAEIPVPFDERRG
jgi:alkylhydroperoxidase family enzyme